MALEQERADAGHEDDLLIQRIARGDPEACDAFVRKYQARLTRLAARLLGWSQDVDDVVQESFVAAILGASRFRQQASVETWLIRITLNQCRTHRRRSRLGLDRLLRLRQRLPRQKLADAADGATLDSEIREKVREAVGRLPARDRELIVLRYLEQMDVDELAEVLNLKRNAVEVRLHRARERLRKLLSGFAEDDRHAT
jgi:RNA polymerase sigma-70 factor (ECF subfamily)